MNTFLSWKDSFHYFLFFRKFQNWTYQDMFEFLTSASTTTKGSSSITTSPRLMDLAAINPVPESGMSDRRNILLCFSAIRSDATPQLCAMFWKFCSSADVVWFGFFWTLQILKQQMQKIFYCPDENNLFCIHTGLHLRLTFCDPAFWITFPWLINSMIFLRIK